MSRKTGIPRIQNPPSGDGHHVTSRYMSATERTTTTDMSEHGINSIKI